jgi:preprotein translocase subunit SecE
LREDEDVLKMAENQKIEKKTDKKIEKKPKKQKPNIGKRLLSFFSNLKAELKRVVWPDRKRLIQSTVTVLAICVLAGVTLFIVDSVLGAALNGIGFYNTKVTTATTAATTVETTTSGTTAATAATAASATTTGTSKAG